MPPTPPKTSTPTQNDPRWSAVLARNPAADGTFVFAVKTTGIYCRPSCAARRARPQNVQFFNTPADAENAGFRPCKRCKPQRPSRQELHTQKIVNACRLIENADTHPDLAQLAAAANMSRYHFHRTFKSITGLTPQDYAAAHRNNRLRKSLKKENSVTTALYHAGFNSSSRFYEKTNTALGMTPTQFRAGGADTDIYFAIGQSSLGAILVAQTIRGVCEISLGDDPATLAKDFQDRFPHANLLGNKSDYETLIAHVIALIDHPETPFPLPLDIRGTTFKQRVWKALQQIPPGTTATYAEIAKKIDSPLAIRAVANACAQNPLALAIPCHRVIRSDNKPSGYRWGLDRKCTLLANEAAAKNTTL